MAREPTHLVTETTTRSHTMYLPEIDTTIMMTITTTVKTPAADPARTVTVLKSQTVTETSRALLMMMATTEVMKEK